MKLRGIPASWIQPDWPAPLQVCACTTTRLGGFSQPPYDSMNLAAHVGDAPAAVAVNRDRLARLLVLPCEPKWLTQVHRADVVEASETPVDCAADAAWTDRRGVVCVVLTADCLPVLLCDRSGSRVAAVHAGWRGLAAGVLEAALDALEVRPSELMAWLGPAIGPTRLEVGACVRDAFVEQDKATQQAFRATSPGCWLVDLYWLARRRLIRRGVNEIYADDYCTAMDSARFFSYRRDGVTGRMATLIWLA